MLKCLCLAVGMGMATYSNADEEKLSSAQAVAKIVACGGTTFPKNGEDVTHVDFWGAPIEDADLRTILAFTKLRVLTFSGCNKLLGSNINFLSKLPELKVLRFKACDELTDASMKSAAMVKGLQTIEVDSCAKITGQGLKDLSKSSDLEKFIFTTSKSQKSSDVIEIGLLDQIKKLIIVDNAGHCVDDTVVTKWCKMKKLEDLHLGGTQVTAVGLKSLCGLTSLKVLCLSGCTHIDDNAIKQLKCFEHLEQLEVTGYCKITDVGLRHIADLERLKTLKLSAYEYFSDEGVASLSALKNLRELTLNTQHTKITPAALKRLQEKLPNLNLVNTARSP